MIYRRSAVVRRLSCARCASPLTGLTSELERERRKDDMAMVDPSTNPYLAVSGRGNPVLPIFVFIAVLRHLQTANTFGSNPYMAPNPFNGGGGATPFNVSSTRLADRLTEIADDNLIRCKFSQWGARLRSILEARPPTLTPW